MIVSTNNRYVAEEGQISFLCGERNEAGLAERQFLSYVVTTWF
jgi:hypothetical protein